MDELDLGQTIRGLVGGQELFGRYVLVRILGRGGMGVVWLARDEKLDRDVALKFLPELIVHDPAVLDELKRETKRSLELTHHNIVRIYDFAEDRQSACISMEYVDGPTLSALRIQRENRVFEVDDLAPWIKQICGALDYAHNQARIVHRDLKPANLMLNRRGDVKVADFGIARSLTDSLSLLTRARGPSGTLVYMSPQQLGGGHASHLDDIYSLGATLYELLTSKPPFYSGNVAGQIENTIAPAVNERRRALDIEAALIPEVWERTVAACLEKDPARRPQSASAVLEHLRGASGTASSSSFHSGPPAPAEKRPASRKRIAILVGLAVITATAVAIWQLTVRPSGEPRLPTSAAPQTVSRQRATEPSSSVAPQPSPSPVPGTLATKERPFKNSLGMKFVPVQGTNVLFAVWETRVGDFRAYAKAAGYQQRGGIFGLKIEKTQKGNFTRELALDQKASWEKPGFDQADDHPVIGISWAEAKEFCAWLTKKERTEGLLTSQQEYRLPTDEEWSGAGGSTKYPWGDKWPPANSAGNYLDEATVRSFGNKANAQIPGDDGYRYTSPVGHYAANAFGLYDLGGNAFEWCEDRYRTEMNPPDILKNNPAYQSAAGNILTVRPTRGGSWLVGDADTARSDCRVPVPEIGRTPFCGFRCVLASTSASARTEGVNSPGFSPSQQESRGASPLPISPKTAPAPSLTPTSRPRISFGGTWSGPLTDKCPGGASSTMTARFRVSDDEKTVWSDFGGGGYGDLKSSVVRNGDTLTWTAKQLQRDGKLGYWVATCSLRLTGTTSASFARTTIGTRGSLKGIKCSGSGRMSR